MEEALASAEDGDYSVMISLLQVIENPYDYSKINEEYTKVPADSNKKYRTFCGT